jgi:pantetheine-phosphate adenylyltransferase
MASLKLPSTAKIGLFTGSFDPLTNGHLDIIQRAAQLFDGLYVGLFDNPKKQALLPLEARFSSLQTSVSPLTNVEVVKPAHALTVTIARELGVKVLVRAVRNAADLDYEKSLDWFNRELTDIETVYLLAKPELQFLSSSAIKELINYKADIRSYVPAAVLQELEKINGK